MISASNMLDKVTGRSRREAELSHQRYAIGGYVMLGLGVLLLYWIFPELQRYMRIRRM